jgi:hypothetical protein
VLLCILLLGLFFVREFLRLFLEMLGKRGEKRKTAFALVNKRERSPSSLS